MQPTGLSDASGLGELLAGLELEEEAWQVHAGITLGRYVNFMKKCTKCEKTKDLSEFYFDKRKGRLYAQCRSCVLEKNRKWSIDSRAMKRALRPPRIKTGPQKIDWTFRRYGLSEDQYLVMLELQGGGCAICGKTPEGRRLSVDHDHESGKVRGLLCDICNRGLGLFKDNTDTLRRAISYLLQHAAK
jgi:hypothetical protein